MAKPLEIDDLWKSRIVKSLSGMEYGSVQIIVHEGRIVQIERTERKRFDAVSASRQDVSGRTAGQ
ncbi:YezD family protein [Paenibacillus aurantius]|uniref:YezD family protein n=1 Tax=Paenibacillus aurantius TaxID=2918900 RepID=A0AA96RH01_9BACL|nr:YezD family protein [Paenibacillus aurantius]WNQ12838.1 YezD family protein [Paenibacillus aurantius]